jgi:hypothetical protein
MSRLSLVVIVQKFSFVFINPQIRALETPSLAYRQGRSGSQMTSIDVTQTYIRKDSETGTCLSYKTTKPTVLNVSQVA